MTTIDPAWLEAFDQELLHFFAIDHGDAGTESTCWAAMQTSRRAKRPCPPPQRRFLPQSPLRKESMQLIRC